MLLLRHRPSVVLLILYSLSVMLLLVMLMGLPDGCSAIPAKITTSTTKVTKVSTTKKTKTTSTRKPKTTTTTKLKSKTSTGKLTTKTKSTTTTTKSRSKTSKISSATKTTVSKTKTTKTTLLTSSTTSLSTSSSSLSGTFSSASATWTTKTTTPSLTSSASTSLITSTTTTTTSASPAPSQCLNPPKSFSPGGSMTHIMRTRGQEARVGAAAIPITYRYGAPVMTNTVTVNLIFYGNWTAGEMALANTFVSGLGGSAWYGINKRYYYAASSTSAKTYVTNVVLGGSVVDSYSLGSSLTGNAVPNIVQNQLNLGAFPVSTDAIYVVAVSKDVAESYGSGSTLCGAYCGYHSYADLPCSGRRIKYSLVANTDQCPSACNVQMTTPNDLPGVDGMLSVLAHEIVEAVSDPELNAWYDSNGYENADKCAWSFGATQTDSNGAEYNINFGGKNYLIQQNWDPNTQACSLS